jgi:hypothetical protein
VKYSKIESFINSIATTRGIAISLNTFERSVESMKTYKDQIVTYLNMINLLKSKFNFANDNVGIPSKYSSLSSLKWAGGTF